MTIWRKRYGSKNITTNTPKIPNNYSYSVRHDNKLVQRTNSILKMASERDKKDFSFKTESNSDISQINFTKHYPKLTITKKYNIPIYYNGIINKKYENPLLKKNNISYYRSNNPLLKNKNILIRNNNKAFPSIKMNTENLLYKNDFNKKKTFEYINYNKEEKNNHNINNFLKNILQKNKDQRNNNINKGNKSEIINDFIYKNIRKINNKKNNNFLNKNNIIKKYSVLSKEANNLVKEYNIRQKKKDKVKNPNNILINKKFSHNTNYIPIKTINVKNNNILINKNEINNIGNNVKLESEYFSKQSGPRKNNNLIQNYERNRNKNILKNFYKN